MAAKIFALALAFLGFVALIVTNAIGWAFYALLTTNSTAFFESLGITDPNIQLVAVIVVGSIILAILIVIGVKKKDLLLDALT